MNYRKTILSAVIAASMGLTISIAGAADTQPAAATATVMAGTAQPAHLDPAALDAQWYVNKANDYLKEEPVTVTAFKAPRREGGNDHDFFSEGDYWWPDPNNPGGPYIQKDGETNPDNFNEHRKAMFHMCIVVPTLTSAYLTTNDQKYADAAVKHLKAWFVDEATHMNPNLEYAQAIHGRAKGRGTGIIDTIHMIEVTRSITLLEKKGVLKGGDLAGVKKWFTDYVHWLTTSENGKQEMNAGNNHGTCWAMQTAAFAVMLGDKETADFCRNRFKTVLLPKQMADDGSFPQELRRTKPYSYSNFNLDAMCTLCQILSTPEDNLWGYTTADGRNMHKGLGFMYPFIADKSKWTKKPDVMFWEFWPVRSPSLLFGGLAYGEQSYLDTWVKLEAHPTNEEVIRNLPIRTPPIWVDVK